MLDLPGSASYSAASCGGEETVARHIKQACERYGVSKRTYLVILTLFDGTLTFSDIFRRRYYPFPE